MLQKPIVNPGHGQQKMSMTWLRLKPSHHFKHCYLVILPIWTISSALDTFNTLHDAQPVTYVIHLLALVIEILVLGYHVSTHGHLLTEVSLLLLLSRQLGLKQ